MGYELYLKHHGILGQKWGIRRYQNEDGTYTKEGKKRKSKEYDDQNVRKTENVSKKKTNSRKFLTIAASAIAISAAAYIGYSYYKNNMEDLSLPAGTEFQRVSEVGEKSLHDVFYASYDKTDNSIYEGIYGFQFLNSRRYGAAAVKTLSSSGNVKIASHSTSKKVLNELIKTVPGFKEKLEKDLSKAGLPGNARTFYEKFNQGIPAAKRLGDDSSYSIFFKALKEKGYGGLIDVNDQKLSGYHSKSPVILFNDSSKSNYSIINTKTYDAKRIEDYLKAMDNVGKANKLIFKRTVKDIAPIVTLGVSSRVVINGLAKNKNKKDKKKKTRSNNYGV